MIRRLEDRMMDAQRLRKLLYELLSSELSATRIVRVALREEIDHEGFLRVDVIYDSANSKVDARKLTGLVRKIRPTLLSEGETGFPIFSFIADSELGRNRRETRRSH